MHGRRNDRQLGLPWLQCIHRELASKENVVVQRLSQVLHSNPRVNCRSLSYGKLKKEHCSLHTSTAHLRTATENVGNQREERRRGRIKGSTVFTLPYCRAKLCMFCMQRRENLYHAGKPKEQSSQQPTVSRIVAHCCSKQSQLHATVLWKTSRAPHKEREAEAFGFSGRSNAQNKKRKSQGSRCEPMHTNAVPTNRFTRPSL